MAQCFCIAWFRLPCAAAYPGRICTRPLKTRNGILELSLFYPHQSEIIQRIDIARLDANELLQHGRRLLEPSSLGQDNPQPVLSHMVPRPQLDHPPVVLLRVREFPLSLARHRPKTPRIGMIEIGLDNPPAQLFRIGKIPRLMVFPGL